MKKDRNILLVGLSFWINLIAERLKGFRFTPIDYYRWWHMPLMEKLAYIDHHDIAHYMWGHYDPKEFIYCRLRGKKSYIHYMGSDVLRAKKFGRKPWWCSFIANGTFCDSPNLQSELLEMGIKADVLPNPVPNLKYSLSAFPIKNRVLAYVNQINENFYHINDVEAIAGACPGWEFLIIGHDGTGRNPCQNIKFCGRVDREGVFRLISESKVYLRLTDHDGTGKMALEAMAMGRYVIRNMNRPHTIYAPDTAAVIAALSRLADENRHNTVAQAYVRQEWDDAITFGRFVKLYR